MTETRKAIWKALASAVLFGASAPLAKALVPQQSAQTLAGILYLGSGLGLGAYALVRRQSAEERLHRSDLPWLAAATLSGGILAPVLLMLGLARVPSSTAAMMLNLEVVFTALIAWFAFREHQHRRTVTGLLLIAIGGLALSYRERLDTAPVIGAFLVAAACLCWAVDNNVTQPISGRDPVQITAWKGLVAGSTNLLLALAIGDALPRLPIVAAGLGVGLLCYGVSLVLFVSALRSLGTARTAACFSVAPFFGAGLGIFGWHEPLTTQFVLAAVFMSAGVFLHASERHRHRHAHERLEHAHLHVHDEHHQHPHVPGDPPGEPHSHSHQHEVMTHDHPHAPDIHHRHPH